MVPLQVHLDDALTGTHLIVLAKEIIMMHLVTDENIIYTCQFVGL